MNTIQKRWFKYKSACERENKYPVTLKEFKTAIGAETLSVAEFIEKENTYQEPKLNDNNSIIQYLKNYWIIDSSFSTPLTVIWGHYIDTMKIKSMSKYNFGRTAAVLLGQSFVSTVNGKSVRCYRVRRITDAPDVPVPQSGDMPNFND